MRFLIPTTTLTLILSLSCLYAATEEDRDGPAQKSPVTPFNTPILDIPSEGAIKDLDDAVESLHLYCAPHPAAASFSPLTQSEEFDKKYTGLLRDWHLQLSAASSIQEKQQTLDFINGSLPMALGDIIHTLRDLRKGLRAKRRDPAWVHLLTDGEAAQAFLHRGYARSRLSPEDILESPRYLLLKVRNARKALGAPAPAFDFVSPEDDEEAPQLVPAPPPGFGSTPPPEEAASEEGDIYTQLTKRWADQLEAATLATYDAVSTQVYDEAIQRLSLLIAGQRELNEQISAANSDEELASQDYTQTPKEKAVELVEFLETETLTGPTLSADTVAPLMAAMYRTQLAGVFQELERRNEALVLERNRLYPALLPAVVEDVNVPEEEA